MSRFKLETTSYSKKLEKSQLSEKKSSIDINTKMTEMLEL